MSFKTLNLSDDLYQYLQSVSLRESTALKQLRDETQQLPGGKMQISPEQGQLMALLVELMGARKTLDIGTFTGYSAGVVAAALPANGQVITCDIDAKITKVAQRYWQQAGLAHKIELRLGPALNTLNTLLAQGQQETFDFAFIDADKRVEDEYYELCLQLLRRGGLLAIDNVLWSGRVIDATNQKKSTVAIRALNKKIHADQRVSISMIPIGDGLTLARKR